MNVLEKIEFEYGVHADQTNLFTNNHIKYDCTIEYDENTFRFEYQCNKKDTPTIEECLACLVSDADGFDCIRDFEDFCDMFGYTKISEYNNAMKAYRACKAISEWMNDNFTSEEREELDELLQDYK